MYELARFYRAWRGKVEDLKSVRIEFGQHQQDNKRKNIHRKEAEKVCIWIS